MLTWGLGMGRKPTISREGLLDLSETIVRNEGAKALTIEALATAAGISKGGVQYSFHSKDELLHALVNRWTDRFDEVLELDRPSSPVELARRYIHAMRASQTAMGSRLAGLLVGYFQDPSNLDETREWYRGVIARLAGNTPEAQAARVAFLAVEGLFLTRIAGIDGDDAWTALLDDIEAVMQRLVP